MAKNVRFADEYKAAAAQVGSLGQEAVQINSSVLFEIATRMNEPSLLQKVPESGPQAPMSTLASESLENGDVAQPSVAPPAVSSLMLEPFDFMKQKVDTEGSSLGNFVRRGKLVHDLPKPQLHPKWKLMRVISGHTGWVRSLTVDVTNEWFASGAGDRTIKVILSSKLGLYTKTYI